MSEKSSIYRKLEEDVESAADLYEALEKLLDWVVDIFDARDGSLMLVDEQEQNLVMRARHRGDLPELDEPMTLAKGQGIAGWVWQEGRPYVCFDTLEDEKYHKTREESPIRAIVSAPVPAPDAMDKVMGVVNIDIAEPHRFTEYDGNRLQTIAKHIAPTVQRIRFRDRLSRLGERSWKQEVDLYQAAIEILYQLFGSAVAVWVLNERKPGTAELGPHRGLADDYVRDREPLDLARSVTLRAIRRGRVLSVFDLQNDPQVSSATREEAKRQGWHSLFVAPLMATGNRAIASISIYSTTQRHLTPWERSLLQTVGGQVGLAIQNARRMRELETISDIVHEISTSLEPDNLLDKIAQIIAKELACSHAALFFPERVDGEGVLKPRYVRGEFSEDVWQRRFRLGPQVAEKEKGLAGWVYERGESVLLADARSDSRFAPPTHGENGPRSILVAPIKVGERVIGVISADQDAYGWFNENDRRLVETLGRHAGIAIERAMGLTSLKDIGGRLAQARDLDKVLEEIVHSAIELMRMDEGIIYLFDPATGQLTGKEYQYPKEFKHTRPRIDQKTGVTYDIITSHNLYLVPDTTRDKRVGPGLAETFKSMIGVPLLLQEQVVGVLYLNAREAREFTDIDRTLLQTLASLGATAVRVQSEKNERIKAIAEIGLRIGATREPKQAIVELLERLLPQLRPGSHGQVCLLDESGAELEVFAYTGAVARPLEKLPVGGDDLPRQKRSVVGLVAKTGAPHVAEDVESDDYYQVHLKGTKSDIAVPIFSGDRLVGVLNTEHPDKNAYSWDDVPLLEAAATQVVATLENARLFRDVEESRDRLNQIVEGSAIPLFVIDRDHRVTHWNQACEQLTGVSAESMVGTNRHWTAYRKEERHLLADLVVDGTIEQRMDELYPGLYRKSAIVEGAYEVAEFFENLNGADRWLLFTAAPLRDAEGRPVGAIETLQDITQTKQIEARQGRLEALKAMSFEVLAGEQLDKVLQNLLGKTQELLPGTTTADVWLLDRPGHELTCRASLSPKGDSAHILPLDGSSRQARVATSDTRQVVIEGNAITAPLNSKEGELIGVLDLEHPGPGFFSETDRPLVEAIASQIAMAIDLTNSRRIAGIYSRIARAGVANIDRVLDALYEACAEVIDLTDTLAYIALYDRDKDEIRFGLMVEQDQQQEMARVRWGRAADGAERRAWLPRSWQSPPGLTEYVIEHGKTLINSDFDHKAKQRGLKVHGAVGERQLPTQAWLGIPLMIRGETIGVISIQSLEREEAFDPTHVALLEKIAEQAALVLDTVRLYQDARVEVTASKQLATLGIATAALQHRVNNTVNVILPNVRRLKIPGRANLDDPIVQDILDIIERNAGYMSDIIKRLHEPLKGTEFEQILVQSVLNDALGEVKARFPSSGEQPTIEFKDDIDPMLPPIEAPSGQISNVFVNLIENGCRAMSATGGVLSARCYGEDDQICVTVSDTGPGMSPKVQERLFKKPVPSREPGGGSGLGLWLNKLFLEQIGGDIRIQNTGHHGTTMLVTIPREPAFIPKG